MATGRYSNSREHRNEAHQIEESFRQLTDQPSQKPKNISPGNPSLFQDPLAFPEDSVLLQDSLSENSSLFEDFLSEDSHPEDFSLFQDSLPEDSSAFQDSMKSPEESPSQYASSALDSEFLLDFSPTRENTDFSLPQESTDFTLPPQEPSEPIERARTNLPSHQDEADFYAFLDDALSSSTLQRSTQTQSSARRRSALDAPSQSRSRSSQTPSSQSRSRSSQGSTSQPRQRSSQASSSQSRQRPASSASRQSRPSGDSSRDSYAASQVRRATGRSSRSDVRNQRSGFAFFWRRYQKPIFIGITLLALIVIGVLAVNMFADSADPYNNLILNNVYLADIPVGGMTKAQAISALKSATDQTYFQQDMVVNLGTRQLVFTPRESGVKLNVNEAVNAAYSYGRTGTQSQQQQDYTDSQTQIHTIGLLPYLELNTNYIRQALASYAQEIGSTLTQPSVSLEGTRPPLATDQFDPNLSGETLVITMGTPGIGFDTTAAYNEILDAYSLNRFQVYIEASDTTQEPQEPDLDELYQQYYVAPVDDQMDMQTYQAIPGSYGVSFDLNQARNLVAQADYGQAVRIPLVYTAPEKTGQNLLFQDVLGECETKHNNDERRNNNLRLACAALDGMILQPGDSFSYNDALGERTAEKGYQPAPAYSGTGLTDSIGGGVCQGSSTLYNCVLLADLEVVERLCHGLTVSYLPLGLDATVSWGFADFKFRNTSNFPIMIKAEISDGYMKMKILGTDERDYYVKMESTYSVIDPETVYQEYPAGNSQGYTDGQVLNGGTTGYFAKSYKVKYDKATGQQISREFEANSSYMKTDRVVVKIVPTYNPPQPTEPKPTQPKPTESNPSETNPGSSSGTTDPTTSGSGSTDPTTSGSGSTAPTTSGSGSSDSGTSGSGSSDSGTSGSGSSDSGTSGSGSSDSGTSGSGSSDSGTSGSGTSGSGSSDSGTSGSGNSGSGSSDSGSSGGSGGSDSGVITE